MAGHPPTRDRERSRQRILEAAESLFAERGYDRVTLAEIGAAAGLSRGAPGYLFGSKLELYQEVLATLFDAREAALREPWQALRDASDHDIPRQLKRAVRVYLEFLHGRPTFLAITEREALAGAPHLAGAPRRSTSIEDALRALSERRGFRLSSALVVVLSVGMFPLVHRDTVLLPRGIDPRRGGARTTHRARHRSRPRRHRGPRRHLSGPCAAAGRPNPESRGPHGPTAGRAWLTRRPRLRNLLVSKLCRRRSDSLVRSSSSISAARTPISRPSGSTTWWATRTGRWCCSEVSSARRAATRGPTGRRATMAVPRSSGAHSSGACRRCVGPSRGHPMGSSRPGSPRGPTSRTAPPPPTRSAPPAAADTDAATDPANGQAALGGRGGTARAFITHALRLHFAEGRTLSDPANVREAAARAGLDPHTALAAPSRPR